MDEVVIPDMVKAEVVFRDEVLPAFEVGKSWPVSQIRNEIAILLSREDIPDFYDLVIEWPGRPDRKINQRLERSTEIQVVMPLGARFKMVV
ncbi:hypothetical protein M758_2G134600 [Ceratodon purpureus]|nr:hypothetical protein M758_2G134600 [Ceratodon purpureus]